MAAESSLSTAAPLQSVAALVFSKDRAWQLKQTINTLNKYCAGLAETHVIFNWTSEQHKSAYASEFEPAPNAVVMHCEKGEGFRQTLLQVCELIWTRFEFLLICVDDVIFFRPLDLLQLAKGFENSRLWCHHLKLDPSKEYCHPADTVCIPPRMAVRKRQSFDGSFVTWPFGHGSHDWRYPWDLCASLYRSCDVQQLLHLLQASDSQALDHPNSLEAGGNALLRAGALDRIRGADTVLLSALMQPAAACITVNRVQDIYKNAIFSGASPSSHSPAGLAKLAGSGTQVQGGWYACHSFSSVHIGHLQCAQEHSCGKASIQVDILMPVYNAASTLTAALHSLCAAPEAQAAAAQADMDLQLHLILVDDGSTDGSWDRLLAVLQGPSHVPCCPPPLPPAVSPHAAAACTGTWEGLSWTAVRCGANAGISRALNIALALTRPTADFIARMDADDVVLPGRLATQCAFLQSNDLHLCGSSAILGTHDAMQAASQSSRPGIVPLPEGDYPLSRPVCHPVLLAWDMLWGCALLHPTIVASAQWWRSADTARVLDMPPHGRTILPSVYSISAQPAEDYDLWLRCLHPAARSPDVPSHAAAASRDAKCTDKVLVESSSTPVLLAANLGAPQLWYRKGGKGGDREALQKARAATAQLGAWNRILGEQYSITAEQLRVLVRPDGLQGASAASVLAAGAALIRVHGTFETRFGLEGAATASQDSIMSQASRCSSFSAVSVSSIRRHLAAETERRLSALAMGGMATLGPAVMPLLKQWRAFKAQHQE